MLIMQTQIRLADLGGNWRRSKLDRQERPCRVSKLEPPRDAGFLMADIRFFLISSGDKCWSVRAYTTITSNSNQDGRRVILLVPGTAEQGLARTGEQVGCLPGPPADISHSEIVASVAENNEQNRKERKEDL
ncbi:hypothetical protein C0Q70_00632 [Pomacea canaliculata]|uniref:Uncharacterized protein n=1 Tax=Pomacea canaliculata TaxID=400727 RepID=A0A2T7PX75_POMCA|nr:hypothetical protein C0Q70_00632 [Pomacea canaliculata]